MQKTIYLSFICLYTLLPLLGLLINSVLSSQFSYDFSELIRANVIHVVILMISVFLAFRVINKKKYTWQFLPIEEGKVAKVLFRSRNMIILFCIINFILAGCQIFSGEDRGIVRTSMGIWGWLYTFIIMYGTPGILALTTVYYFFFSNKRKKITHVYWQTIFFSLLIAVMTGGKSNIVVMCFAPLLQYSSLLKKKYLFYFFLFGIVAITIAGMLQMNMTFTDSFHYNIYRATNLAAFGTMSVWDLYPNGAEGPYLTLWGAFGEKLTSFFTGVDVHSVEFLDYSLARKITYLYYGDSDGALAGTVNLTVTSFGETVFWFGRKYYFILSVVMALFLYYLTIWVFKTRSYNTIILNILFTIYYIAPFLGWLNSASLASLFGITTLFYMFLLNVLLRYLVVKQVLK